VLLGVADARRQSLDPPQPQRPANQQLADDHALLGLTLTAGYPAKPGQ
jgi:hypothetical protein